MVAVNGLSLLHVEACRVSNNVVHVEVLNELVDAEDVLVCRQGPAQQGQVVQQTFLDEAGVAQQEEVRLGVALGELLVALAHDVGQVAKLGNEGGHTGVDERAVERNLARGGGEQVLTAQHVGDAHERVVNGVHEGVQRVAVGADDHVVGYGTGLEGDFAANQVVEGDVLIGHAQTPHGLAALSAVGFLLLLGEAAVVVVVAELRVLAGCLAAFLHLVGGGEVLVHVAALNELLEDLVIDAGGLTLGLAVGLVRAANAHAFVPVDAEPVQGLEHLVERLFGVAGGVGVLNAEDELTAGVACVGPVEEGGAHHAHVRGAGGRGAETHTGVCGGVEYGTVVFGHDVSLTVCSGWTVDDVGRGRFSRVRG